jgi:prepilin-type N-terminal cleavage/methylation domain-containing protein
MSKKHVTLQKSKLLEETAGFTLVELLIVISIISILSAILYRVIDVTGIRNRARNSNVFTAAEKVAYSVESFISSYGRTPNGLEFSGLINDLVPGVGCNDTVEYCVFALPGFDLPADECPSGSYMGSGSAQCSFFYQGNLGGDPYLYQVLGQSWGTDDILIGTLGGRAVECPGDGAGSYACTPIVD